MPIQVRDALGQTQTVETLPAKGQAPAAASLPVVFASDQAFGASGKTAVTGVFTGAGQSAAFIPLAGRSFNVSVWGSFVGSATLERSFNGSTWLPVTAGGQPIYVFTGPVSEQVQEDEYGVQYRLNCTALASGSINYRISQ